MGYRDSNWDVPDPGTQKTSAPRASVCCRQCAWSASDAFAVVVVEAGKRHAAETGHDLTGRAWTEAQRVAAMAKAVA